MTILVTGAAGFIGYHAALRLLSQGERVVGIDNMNPY
ncbi:MAG: NAD-dependent epimerase/dehydratase family protein, partial [Alphaproteobacteria bacterium]